MKTHQFLFIAAFVLASASCSDNGDKATTQEQTDTQEEATQEQSDNQTDDENEATEEESDDENALVDYVKTPLDKAKAVEGLLQDAADQQRQEIDEATE